MALGTNMINGRHSDSITDGLRRTNNQGERSGNALQNGLYNPHNLELKAEHDVNYPENQWRQQLENSRSRTDKSGSKYRAIIEISSRQINDNARIRIEPFFVPETSPIKDRSHDDSNDAMGGPFSESEQAYTDKSDETAEQHRFGYDDEESFILQDSGVDSRHGSIHYPKFLQKAGMKLEELENGAHRPAIIVTKPYRHGTPKYSSSTPTKDVDRITSRNSLDDGMDVASTGNSDRDDVMKRARDLLAAHQLRESSRDKRIDKESNNSSSLHSFRGHTESDQESGDHPRQERFDDELMDDGLAPLGGYWPSPFDERRNFSLDNMLANPTSNLAAIHAEAARLLKVRSEYSTSSFA
jgi:hypothetical protein